LRDRAGTSGNCNYGAGAAILTRWVTEMSAYIKSIDSNHMVAVGDEGFGCFDGNSVRTHSRSHHTLTRADHASDDRSRSHQVGWDWTLDCYTGVDTIAFGRVSTIDFLTAHLYPSHWSKSTQWGDEWIQKHAQWAHEQVGKPVVMEEFGISYGTCM
jgi:mannan endo-1,4-beta-mannosidase